MLHSFTLYYPNKRKFHSQYQGVILADLLADGIDETRWLAERLNQYNGLLKALQLPEVNFIDTIQAYCPDIKTIPTKKVGKLTQYSLPFLYIFEQQ